MFPAPDVRGPKVLLGVVWAAAVVGALVSGTAPFALLMAAAAGAAAAQAARTWRHVAPARHPVVPAALAIAAVAVLGAALGATGFVVVAVLAVAGGAVWAWAASGGSPRDVALTVVCAAVPAAAVAGAVLLRRSSLEVPFILMAIALLYDAGSWVIGSGSRHRWLGPLAGMACIVPVTMLVAALGLQFRSADAWLLGALAAVLSPLGPAVATFVLGDRRGHAPALRRIDSLVVLGPVWSLVAAHLRA
ncbi:MAG TPA: hypothetical protein VFA84_13470 [Acidimicrobiales bacterium]|nr:hypothetical protein [Acidimicrobiales bacterium]